MDSRRFGAQYANLDYTLARTVEVYSTYYDVKYPGHERQAGRPLKLSPTYERLRELGAAFGEKSGWERANWFEPNAAAGDEALRPRGWAGRLWSPAIGAEHRACREAAALFDETSFAKIEVSGEGAPDFLERLCANSVAREVGQITYTSMLNARGGIECDFTVTRLAEHRFRIVTGTAFGQHDLAWIRQHAPDDGSVVVSDVTADTRASASGGRRRARSSPPSRRTTSVPLHASGEIVVGRGPLPRAPRDVRRRAGLGALLRDGARARALGHALAAGRDHGLALPATRRSTRCGSRRVTGCGAPTSRRTTRPSRRGSASR